MWHEALDKNIAICNLYNEVPELKNVRIAEINILQEGDKVSIKFDMPSHADNPPKKWNILSYNTTIVEIDLFEIKEISIKSLSRNYSGNIEIEKIDEDIEVNITGTVEAKIIAVTGLVQSVGGYHNNI
ncbi:immunity 50 family protein [Bacillus spizizenii]|nr:immunity 50 family protein [Bacillus spizizenii]MCY8131330.1 immunity 50 family protein [Bacillus spizizenii]